MPDDQPLLSQSEIDRLLGTHSGPGIGPGSEAEAGAEAPGEAGTPDGPEVGASGEGLGSAQADALAEVSTVSMGSASTALSSILGHKVTITAPKVTVHSREGFRKQVEQPMLAVEVRFEDGLVGQSLFLLGEPEAKTMAAIMLGDLAEEAGEELNELELSALAEAMNQMMGSAATAMTNMIHRSVNITPPVVRRKDLAVESLVEVEEPMVVVEFDMTVDGLFETSFFQLMPLKVGQQLAEQLLASVGGESEKPTGSEAVPAAVEAEPAAAAPQPAAPQAPTASSLASPPPAAAGGSGGSAQGERPAFEPSPLTLRSQPDLGNLRIDLIRDIPVQISARLGRARLSVAEILSMGAGSVVELDRMEGEPIELLANGVPVAKGEVVVIGGERYGVRITEIVDPTERVRSVS